jgi:hypothetical protein
MFGIMFQMLRTIALSGNSRTAAPRERLSSLQAFILLIRINHMTDSYHTILWHVFRYLFKKQNLDWEIHYYENDCFRYQ